MGFLRRSTKWTTIRRSRKNRSAARVALGAVAKAFLAQQAGDSLTRTVVSSAGSTATQVRIEVTGVSLSVLPGVNGLAVTESVTAPVERFTTDSTP